MQEKIILLIVGLLIGLAALILGCSKKDVKSTVDVMSVGTSIGVLVNSWPEDKAVLQKYQAKLPPDTDDYKSLSLIISTGDIIHYDLTQMHKTLNVPSVARIKMTYREANAMYENGKKLYEKYKDSISPEDRIKAHEFAAQWQTITKSINSLSNDEEKNTRYSAMREMAEFAVDVTGQVIIPVLKATKTIQ